MFWATIRHTFAVVAIINHCQGRSEWLKLPRDRRRHHLCPPQSRKPPQHKALCLVFPSITPHHDPYPLRHDLLRIQLGPCRWLCLSLAPPLESSVHRPKPKTQIWLLAQVTFFFPSSFVKVSFASCLSLFWKWKS